MKIIIIILQSILPVWSHGADPFRSLQVKNILNKFKKNLEEDPDYLKNKLKELFIVSVFNFFECLYNL